MKLTSNERNAYDALSYLTQVSRLDITPSSVKEQLYLHPDFPSLLSMSDVLTGWSVTNLATRIRVEQLAEIPLPAICFLDINGGYFAPIRKVTDKKVEWLDTDQGWQTDTITDFMRKWNGIVLLIEPNTNSGESDYQQKKRNELLSNARLPVIILSLIICLFCAIQLLAPSAIFSTSWGLLLVKFIGIGVTTLLLSHVIDANNSILQSLCGLDSRTDCNNVLTSKAAKLWGWLGWAEIGFIYFSGSFILLLLGINIVQTSILSWLTVLNMLALPYTIYSIYYQYKIAKSWCPLCLIVQALLWLEFILGVSHWEMNALILNAKLIMLFSLSFLIPTAMWMLLKQPLQESTLIFPLRRELQKAKFNLEYVESLFTRQPKMPPIFEGMRIVRTGNIEAKHTLTIVTNPLCGPCRKLHPELEALIQRTNAINCQFIFIGSPASVPIIQKLMRLKPIHAAKAMHLWYIRNDQNITKWSESIDYQDEFSDVIQQMQLHARWCEMAQITSTPTIYLNGRQLPITYTISDVENLCRILAAPQPMELADSHKSII